jgi:hypothetical protein
LRLCADDVRAGRVQIRRSTPDLDHGRVYAGYAEGGLTGPLNAMLKSIQVTLADMNYLREENAPNLPSYKRDDGSILGSTRLME